MKPWAAQFYNSDAWRDCRASFLFDKDNLCERCLTHGAYELATIAHHKVYLTPKNINDPWISLSWDNLEALCQDCHNKEHHRIKKALGGGRYKYDAQGNLLEASPPSDALG